MNSQLNRTSSWYRKLWIGVIIWIVTGIGMVYPNYEIVWEMGKLNQLSQEERNLNLYGSDYEGYKTLAKTPSKTKILFLVPDDYYWTKSVFFLYPRKITHITNPSELERLNLRNFDYFVNYFSLTDFAGYIGGMNRNQQQWDLEQLLDYSKKLGLQKNEVDLESFEQNIIKNKGLLIYKLN